MTNLEYGDGKQAYKFVEKPTDENPSGLWTNYSGCKQLSIQGSYDQTTTWLFECDAVDCCFNEGDAAQPILEVQV